MQPAVEVVLAGASFISQLTARATLETRGLLRLKRPHSRRNPWQPECGKFTLINGANSYRYWDETGISSSNF